MNTHPGRRRLLTLAIALLAASPYSAPARAAVSGVDEGTSSFSPKRVEIALNDKVVWTNRSSATHTVTFDDGTDLHSACDPKAILRVGCQGPGATAERKFGAFLVAFKVKRFDDGWEMMNENGRVELCRNISFVRGTEIAAPFKIVFQFAFRKTFLENFDRIILMYPRKSGG